MSSKILSLFQVSLLAALCLCFTACSPTNGSRTITVDAGFQVRGSAPYNLSEKLSHMMVTSPNPDVCLQDQVYLVVHDHTTDQVVSTQQVRLFSNITAIPTATPNYDGTSTDVGFAIDWMQNYSYIQTPLSITVPNGNDVYETAIIGQFFHPQDSDLDGICDQTVTGNPLVALGSSAMFGRAELTQNQSGTLTLDMAVIHTNPNSQYTNPWLLNPGYWTQLDMNLPDLNVSNIAVARLKTISYLNGLIHFKVDNTTAASYYVPSIFPGPYTFTFEEGAATYTSTIMNPSNCGGTNPNCGMTPMQDPVYVSGTMTYVNTVIDTNPAHTVASGNVTFSTVYFATSILTINTSEGGTCTGIVTVTAPGGASSTTSNANDTITLPVTTPIFTSIPNHNLVVSPDFTGHITLNVTNPAGISLNGTYSGSCPIIAQDNYNATAGYGAIAH